VAIAPPMKVRLCLLNAALPGLIGLISFVNIERVLSGPKFNEGRPPQGSPQEWPLPLLREVTILFEAFSLIQSA
jgi:hypothetical protein